MSSTFDRVLAVLRDLKRSGELYVALLPPFEATFEIPRDAYRAAWKQAGLEEAEFESELDQIAGMVQAALAGETKQYVAHMLGRAKERAEGEQETEGRLSQEEIERRVGEVEAAVVDRRLRSRYLLKVSSKAPSFTNIDWDLKMKRKDAKREVVFPYATCKIKFQREFELTPYALLSGRQFDAVQINFTCDDVEYVTRVLNLIRVQLEAMEKEVLGGDGQ